MGDVLDRRRLLSCALARLIERPDTDLTEIPGHVAASWRRSLAGGVDPGVVANLHNPGLELDSRLVRCARPVIEQLAEQLAGAPVCVVLTDDRARLLVRRDTTVAIGRAADDNYFAEGFGYAEGAVGTNGVGTVLEAGKSMHIVGAEHFVEPLQSYACAGAPVRDPITGRIHGVLDISCRAEHSSPILHSLVTSAAGRIQDALLRDRDTGQQAVFTLYTRVDSRSRGAVLALGRRMVLANTELQTLLDPGDLAALTDHARSRMPAGSDVDDRLDLPSGARVRVRGTTVTVGSSVAGLVAVISVVREADVVAVTRGAPVHRRLPVSVGTSPAWRAVWTAAAEALGVGTALLVAGEVGSGRRRLLTDLDRALHGPGRVVEVGPADADPGARIRCAGPSPLVVLRDLDRWTTVPPGMTAAVRTSRARLAATTADRARCRVDGLTVLAWFRRSVTVPPLRNRAQDLPALVTDVLADVAPGRDVQVSAEAMRVLVRHGWPGNMVELRDALATAVRRRPAGVVEIGDLPESCQSAPRGALRPIDQAERDAFVAALRQFDGNRTAAATALGVARSTLYRKIAQYGITA